MNVWTTLKILVICVDTVKLILVIFVDIAKTKNESGEFLRVSNGHIGIF